MKKLLIFILLVLFIFPVFGFCKNVSAAPRKASVSGVKGASLSVEEQFKKSFPKNKFESILPTEISGIHEVYTGNQIYYYMPKDDVVLYGSLVSKDGVNITRESQLKKMAQKMAKIPLDGALKMGNGKTAVVEFIDPHCYHCRQAYKFFSQRKDVTVHVFFFPLSKESADKIKHIYCSKDVIKTYEDVMTGKLDNNANLNLCADKQVDEKVKAHMQLASQVGLRGTPLFYIKGQVVDGFDPPAIEKLLKD